MAIKITGTNTAAAPGITGDDTDTGLVYGTNQVDISTGGTSKVTVGSTGRVGINEGTPNATLHIKNADGANNRLELVHANDAANEQNQITFKNNTTQTAYIVSGKDGSNNNLGLSFGTGTTERMKIDSSGRVTTPNQPFSFYCALSNSHTSHATDSTETLVFSDIKLNTGSHYDTSNGRFTAPVAGTYLVGHNCLIDNNASQLSRSADLQKNGSGFVTMWYDNSGGESRYHGVSGTAILTLAANDYLSIRATSGIHVGSETNFFVYLLG